MNDQPLHFALRELRALLRNRRLVGLFAMVVALFIITGPFGTLEYMSLSIRSLFWLGVQGFAWPISIFGALVVSNLPRTRRWPAIVRALFVGTVAAVPIAFISDLLVWLTIGRAMSLATYLETFLRSVPIGTILSLASSYMLNDPTASQPTTTSEPPAPAPPPPRLYGRLAPRLGRTILYLATQDHYVEVVTDLGSDLILMRMADAITELEGLPGLRIHRSYWVAEAQVRTMVREEERWMVELSNGKRLPISRTALPHAKAMFIKN